MFYVTIKYFNYSMLKLQVITVLMLKFWIGFNN